MGPFQLQQSQLLCPQHHVGFQFLREMQGFQPVLGLAYHFHIVFQCQQRGQTLTHERLIVHHQDAQRGLARLGCMG